VHVAAIIAAGGRGTRLGAGVPKQLLVVGGRSILQRSVEAMLDSDRIDEVVVVLPPSLAADPPGYLRQARKPVTVVGGGPRRQDSVASGFAALGDRADLIVIHDAARPFVTADLIARTIDAALETGAAVAAVPARDTVKLARDAAPGDQAFVSRTVPRERVFLAQTPQVFRRDVLRAALAAGETGTEATDEAALAEATGCPVRIVAGDPGNLKITTAEDLALARWMSARGTGRMATTRVGTGYDLHRLVPGRRLVLGGIEVPSDKGLDGHSDADVLSHAITDAVLGAVAAGDIGRHFPDTDPRWKDAPSLAMLSHAVAQADAAGYSVANVDAVVIAEHPKLAPHVDAIRRSLATVLRVESAQVSVKGKTNEGIGELGRGEAMAVHAVALLVEKPS
jgi:2-C-methyl-D-erythritol 4-phosphate cytidylyltransferase/2-C-methyl-D-erythritol 2,4-cyclodiphosphate synthase